MKKLTLPTSKKRNAVTLVLVLALALVLLAVNILLPYLMHRGNLYPDLTTEGLYTMSDELVEELSYLEEDVKIIFCTDPDYLFSSKETRLPYVTCKKLAAKNEHISIEYLDVANDPSAADDYKTTEGSKVTWKDIIVSTGGRYKILSPAAFFGSEDDEYVSYNGEYRIATAILSLTAYKNGPCAYFTYGHGERYYIEGDEGSDASLSAFYGLLLDLGMRVGKLNLDEIDEIPDDCSLLLMCGPSSDYPMDVSSYDNVSALEKIDKYLLKRNALMVFRDALATPLPSLEEYLEEWGIAFGGTLVTSKENSLSDASVGVLSGDRLIAVYPDEESAPLGYSMFSSVIEMATPPKTVIANAGSLYTPWKNSSLTVADNTSRYVCAAFYAPADAEAKDKDGLSVPAPAGGAHWLAAISTESRLLGGEYSYSYVFAAASTEMITNRYLADAAYGNGDVLFSALRHISRTDVFASSALGGFDLNSDNYGGKMFDETHLTAGKENLVYHSLSSYTTYAGIGGGTYAFVLITVVLLPVAATGACAFAVLQKRRHK